jgi:hypothetical protein
MLTAATDRVQRLQPDCAKVWLFWLMPAPETEFAGVLNVTLRLDEPLSSAACAVASVP